MRSTPMRNSGLEAVISHHEKKGAGRRAKAIAAIAYAAGSQIPFAPGENGVFDGDVLEEAASYIESLYPEAKVKKTSAEGRTIGGSYKVYSPLHSIQNYPQVFESRPAVSVPDYEGGGRVMWEIGRDSGLVTQKWGAQEYILGPLPTAYFNPQSDTLPPMLSPDPSEPESK